MTNIDNPSRPEPEPKCNHKKEWVNNEMQYCKWCKKYFDRAGVYLGK